VNVQFYDVRDGSSICNRIVNQKASMTTRNVTRREILKIGATTAAAEIAAALLAGCGGGGGGNTPPPAGCAKLTDIEHVVV
jgi:hypothetical protein